MRRVGCDRNPPRTGLRRLWQSGKVGGKPRDLRVTELLSGEGRHDAPGLSHRLLELRRRQSTAGKVGTKGAFAALAVTVLAEGLIAFPQRLGASNNCHG